MHILYWAGGSVQLFVVDDAAGTWIQDDQRYFEGIVCGESYLGFYLCIFTASAELLLCGHRKCYSLDTNVEHDGISHAPFLRSPSKAFKLCA